MRLRSSDIQHSTLEFIIQHSSFKLKFTDEWLTFWSESAKSVGRKESRKHKRHRSLHGSTCRMDSNATNARSALRCVAEQLLTFANDGQ